MFKPARLLLSFLMIMSLPLTLSAADASVAAPATAAASNPWGSFLVPNAPSLNAKAYVLMDAKSGEVMAAKNEHLRIPPASLTKLMTLYLVFRDLATGRIHLDDDVTISKDAWQTGGSRMFIKVGSEVKVSDLIQGVIVQSGNDATMALAEYVGGTEDAFVQMMDQQAKALGMNDSHFSDPTGLPKPDHLTTAYDLALLARAIITQYPQYYHFFGEKWFTWNHIRQPNRNRLLWRNFNVDGMKTGHTEEAGYCQVSSAEQQDTRFISVVLGTPTDADRANESQALLNYGFRFFETAQIYKANAVISEQRAWKAENKIIALGVAQDFYVTIPRSAYSQLNVSLKINSEIEAPITKGQAFGSVVVALGTQQIASAPLVALADDPRGGWWTRFIDAITHWFHKIFHKKEASQIVIGADKQS